MATHATVWSGLLSQASGSLAAGLAVVKNGDVFLPATTANRASYGRAVGVAITSADSTVRSFEYQVAGVLSAELSGLPDGSTGDWVIVTSTGALERDASPDAGEDVIGRCTHTGGDVQIMPGVWDETNTLGGVVDGGTPGGSDTQVQFNDEGALGGSSKFTFDKTTGVVTLTDGTAASTTGNLNTSNNWFWWARDSFDSSDIQILGLTAGDVIELGASSGADIVIGSGLGQLVTVEATETVLTGSLQLGSGATGFAGGSPALALKYGTTPSLPSAGKVLVFDDADDILNYANSVGYERLRDAVAVWDDGNLGDRRNIVSYYPDWTGVESAFTRALIDNTKVGIVSFAADTNEEAILDPPVAQDAFGVTGNYAFAHGNMVSVTGDYAAGFGLRPNARGFYSFAAGGHSFADNTGCTAFGWRCVAGSLDDDENNTVEGVGHKYAFAAGESSQARGHGSFVFGYQLLIGYDATYAVAFGYNCSIADTGLYAFAAGNQSVADGRASVAMGEASEVSANYGVALGRFNDVSGEGGTAFGRDNTVSAEYGAIPGGFNNTVSAPLGLAHGQETTASRPGEYAHGVFEANSGAFKRNLLQNVSTNGNTVDLFDEGAIDELALTNNRSYLMRIMVLGSRTDATGTGGRVINAVVRASGGTATIIHQANDYDQLAAGWAVVLSAPSGLTLRLRCNGDTGQTVKFSAAIEWVEVESA